MERSKVPALGAAFVAGAVIAFLAHDPVMDAASSYLQPPPKRLSLCEHVVRWKKGLKPDQYKRLDWSENQTSLGPIVFVNFRVLGLGNRPDSESASCMYEPPSPISPYHANLASVVIDGEVLNEVEVSAASISWTVSSGQ